MSSAHPEQDYPAPRTIHLHSLQFERIVRSAALQHGLAGLMLLLAGVEQLQEPEPQHAFFAWLGVSAGAFLLAAVVYELRQLRRHEHSVIGWVDLFAVPTLIVEALHKLHRGTRYLHYAYFFLAALMLARALLHSRLAHLRRITLDENGLSARLSPLQKMHWLWRNVAALTCPEAGIEITARDGTKQTISLKQIWNRAEAQEKVLEYYRLVQQSADTKSMP